MADTIPQMDDLLNQAVANIAALQQNTSSLLLHGRKFFVDPNPTYGSNSNIGSSSYPFLTLAHALSVVAEFDTIAFQGTVSEDSLILAVPNVALVGLGVSNAGAILQNAVADKTLLNVAAINCMLANFKVRPPAYAAGVPKGIAISAAHYLEIVRMRFQGKAASWHALYSDVTSDNVKIRGCEFLYNNTAVNGHAILGVAAAGTVHSGWEIENNIFSGNVNHYIAPSAGCRIRKNVFGHEGLGPAGAAIATTTKIDVSGSNAGYNDIVDNDFGGTYSHSGGYQEAPNDNWAGNRFNNAGTGAITGAVPA